MVMDTSFLKREIVLGPTVQKKLTYFGRSHCAWCPIKLHWNSTTKRNSN